ncbi:MAG: hypothetical protein JOZ95_08130 [Solirubrobacterales bacterium]|nr:hypothetical protein [Solirubrobacterales bacterium]
MAGVEFLGGRLRASSSCPPVAGVEFLPGGWRASSSGWVRVHSAPLVLAAGGRGASVAPWCA